MKVKRFRKRPLEVEAVQFDGQQVRNVLEAFDNKINYVASDGVDRLFLSIRTLEGLMEVSPGDWIIKGIKGEFYPCKPDVFEATYEEVMETMYD